MVPYNPYLSEWRFIQHKLDVFRRHDGTIRRHDGTITKTIFFYIFNTKKFNPSKVAVSACCFLEYITLLRLTVACKLFQIVLKQFTKEKFNYLYLSKIKHTCTPGVKMCRQAIGQSLEKKNTEFIQKNHITPSYKIVIIIYKMTYWPTVQVYINCCPLLRGTAIT